MRAALFGRDRRVAELESEPEAKNSRMKVDGGAVNHDESGGGGGDV